MQSVIELENVSKVFRLYPDLIKSRIKQYIFFWKKYYVEKKALNGISLKIKKGNYEIIMVLGKTRCC